MDRSEAEAVYASGRERCVEFILGLTRGFEQLGAANARLEERVRRLEEQSRASSRNSSKPPSGDPQKTRQQRRADARAKAKELLQGEGKREAGGQPHVRTEPSYMSKDKPAQILQTSFDRRTRSHTYAAWTSTIRWGSKRKWADSDPILETRSASTPNGALGSGRKRA
jgi:hypothetical protein